MRGAVNEQYEVDAWALELGRSIRNQPRQRDDCGRRNSTDPRLYSAK